MMWRSRYRCVQCCEVWAEFALGSARVRGAGGAALSLPAGTEVEVLERRRAATGALRLRCAAGWLSEHTPDGGERAFPHCMRPF
jgi:hypothetical protein